MPTVHYARFVQVSLYPYKSILSISFTHTLIPISICIYVYVCLKVTAKVIRIWYFSLLHLHIHTLHIKLQISQDFRSSIRLSARFNSLTRLKVLMPRRARHFTPKLLHGNLTTCNWTEMLLFICLYMWKPISFAVIPRKCLLSFVLVFVIAVRKRTFCIEIGRASCRERV